MPPKKMMCADPAAAAGGGAPTTPAAVKPKIVKLEDVAAEMEKKRKAKQPAAEKKQKNDQQAAEKKNQQEGKQPQGGKKFSGKVDVEAFINAGWRQNKEDANRLDYPGTSNCNELLKNRPELLDRNVAALLRGLIYPLHNHLQRNHGLDNEDEIQLMVMPPSKDGLRDVFFASNTEKIKQEHLTEVMVGWNTAKNLKIRGLKLVATGEKGRHAEQKLLDHFISISSRYDFRRENALIVGERFPCAACRIHFLQKQYAHLPVTILPTHGHFYLSTVRHTPAVGEMQPAALMEMLRQKKGSVCPPPKRKEMGPAPKPEGLEVEKDDDDDKDENPVISGGGVRFDVDDEEEEEEKEPKGKGLFGTPAPRIGGGKSKRKKKLDKARKSKRFQKR